MSPRPGGELRAQLRVGSVEIDLVSRRVLLSGKPVELSGLQVSLLYILVAHAGEVLTRKQILERAWGGDVVDPNAVDQRIRHLRARLGDDARRPRYIETVLGKGYRFIGAKRS